MKVNIETRELFCKIVVWGAPKIGKTTFLEEALALASPSPGEGLTSISTEGDRTIFGSLCTKRRVGPLSVKVELYTVAGAVYYQATKRLALQGVDGVVFVVDSSGERQEENELEAERLVDYLPAGAGVLDPEAWLKQNLVLLWNQRDRATAVPVSKLQATLNRWDAPAYESLLGYGVGIKLALDEILDRVLARASTELGLS